MTSEIPQEGAAVAKAAKRWRVRMAMSALILAAILIGGSGQVGWAAAYAYVAVVAAGQIAAYNALYRKSPDLLVERARMQAGTKPWDKVIAPLIAIVLPFAIWIVAALDTRLGWSRVPWPWQAVGWTFATLGIGLMMWAMIVNRFFAATVRIQTERDHKVVCNGPYAYVRHPGYVGMIVYMVGTAPALDSTWALIPWHMRGRHCAPYGAGGPHAPQGTGRVCGLRGEGAVEAGAAALVIAAAKRQHSLHPHRAQARETARTMPSAV